MTPSHPILIAGESWTTHSIHQKGFDSFTTTDYVEGVHALRKALEDRVWRIVYQPSHVAAREFPSSAESLSARFSTVVLSDIGSNTLLLHPDTFSKSRRTPNRLAAIRDFVAAGGGLVMIGGYLSFQGIDAKARYGGSPIEEALPVQMLGGDDRVEMPEGGIADVGLPDHPIVAGLDSPWPPLLGYNRVSASPGSSVVATIGNDPLLVTGRFGNGRCVAFMSDCGPHWAPDEFVNWRGYRTLWQQIAGWVAAR